MNGMRRRRVCVRCMGGEEWLEWVSVVGGYDMLGVGWEGGRVGKGRERVKGLRS